MRTVLITILLLLLFTTAGFSQSEEQPILQAQLILPAEQLSGQNSYQVLVQMDIAPTWHINSNQPLEDFLIPTEIFFDETAGISFGKIQYEKPDLRRFAFSENDMAVYEHRVYALANITLQPGTSADSLRISGAVNYQACNDQSCLAPSEALFSKTVKLLPADTQVEYINTELFEEISPRFAQEEVPSVPQEKSVSDVLKESGLVYAFLFIFLGGLALNLTPCVYPLIPITISYFGGQSEGKKGGLILRAVFYVLGMSVTYSVLGVVAALTGGLLGSALQNPLVLVFVAGVLVALSLSMFGVYEITVPQSLAMVGGKNRSGYLGTLFMGLTVGLIAAPCIGPFVLGLLTYVGEIGDPFLGFWMFFVLAMGLGTPFLFLGIFSGAATKLPRSGAWMIWVRAVFGFILIGMAVYFLEPLIPGEHLYNWILALIAVAAGVYLGWLDKNKGAAGFMITRKVVGIAAILFGIFMAWPSTQSEGQGIDWQPYSDQAVEQAAQSGQAVIIDFYADWCIPCKELDKFTFTDERVISLSRNIVMLKSDLTKFDSENTTAIREKYDIKGVPTIVFIGPDGQEVLPVRLVGFEEADQFLQRMETVHSSN